MCCLPRRVLPELQATSAGGCSLITVINLATDRGRERQGAGGGGGGGGGLWWRRKVVTGRGWMEEGRREGSVKKMVCFLNTCAHILC